MIEKIVLRNFKGIREGELELAPLTILLGGNNSGKTTLLEALFLAPNPFRKVSFEFPPMNAVELVRFMHETLKSEDFRFLLHNYMAENALISCKVGERVYSTMFAVRGNRINVYYVESTLVPTLENLSSLKIENLIGYFPDFRRIEEYRERMPFENVLLFQSYLVRMGWDYIRSVWATVVNSGASTRVARTVSKLVHENYLDLTLEPFFGDEVGPYMYLDDGRRVRVGDLGDGVRGLVTLMLLYELVKPGVLLWDDVEAHMNPRMLLFVARWVADLVDKGVQVVLSTHSIEALRTIAGLVEDKDVRIYLLTLERGVLKSKGLSLRDVEELWKAGIDIRVGEPYLL